MLPTLNEEGALRLVLPRLKAVFARLGLRGEVLVVDGRSKDATVAVAKAAARSAAISRKATAAIAMRIRSLQMIGD